MITKMSCACGNTDVKKAVHYDGCLGYEAIVCTCCGGYSDHTAEHKADEWSKAFLKKVYGIIIT